MVSVTHPDMDWEGYEMRAQMGVDLPAESDIYHHRFCDYLEWIDESSLALDRLVQLPVPESIRHLLTPAPHRRVDCPSPDRRGSHPGRRRLTRVYLGTCARIAVERDDLRGEHHRPMIRRRRRPGPRRRPRVTILPP